MFERYTEKARRVIFFARYEASQFGSPYIETEHLLLGLIREDKTLANRFLRSHAALDSIRKQIEAHTTMREKVPTSVDLPLSHECKRVLAYAAEEADDEPRQSRGDGAEYVDRHPDGREEGRGEPHADGAECVGPLARQPARGDDHPEQGVADNRADEGVDQREPEAAGEDRKDGHGGRLRYRPRASRGEGDGGDKHPARRGAG